MNTTKKWIALLTTASIMACGKKSGPEERILYYPNSNKVMRKYTENQGKIEGKMQEFYPEGPLKMERDFKNGLEDGLNTLYYPDGQIKEKQHFVQGVQQLGDTIFYPGNKPQLIVTFKDGKKNGLLQKWSPEGALSFEAMYENDALKTVTKTPNTVEKSETSK
ncbi:MAG: hypothetical protein KGS48_00290 [Bacteroidetes bacterium]|nr:hypothetical protein [Bacteroidota bacterium]